MIKVISMSLWGNQRLYCCGAIRNVRAAKEVLPGWDFWIYYDSTVPEKTLLALEEEGAELIEQKQALGFSGLFWRMKPINYAGHIERFIVRDSDSLINARDAACIKEWEDSGEPAHIIRDCESHGAWMLGATWGARPDFLCDAYHGDYDDMTMQFFQDYHEGKAAIYGGFDNAARGRMYGVDQQFLSHTIWPLIKDHHIAHDEHFKFTGRERPFPTKLRRDLGEAYVGMVCELPEEWQKYEYT